MSSLSSYQSQNMVFGGVIVLGVVVRSTDCPLMPFYCRLWCPWMLSTSIREDLINFDVLLCEPDPPLRVGGAIFVVWWSRELVRARASARGRMTQTRPSCVSINHKTSQHLLSFLYDGQRQPAAIQCCVHDLGRDGWLRSQTLTESERDAGSFIWRGQDLQLVVAVVQL